MDTFAQIKLDILNGGISSFFACSFLIIFKPIVGFLVYIVLISVLAFFLKVEAQD